MRYRKAYEWGRVRLEMAKISEAALDARLILEHVCGTDRNDLYAHSETELSQTQIDEYEDKIRKRAEHIPLQHITGMQNFMGLSIKVTDKVLVPRQDTEILAEEALIAVNDGDRILDVCTGSGCVLLSVVKYKNDVVGIGTDISEDALEVARDNYASLKEQINGKVSFVQGDLFENVDGRFDTILSNPPYIPTADIEELSLEVKEHDPIIALDGGEDGLDFYRRITSEAPKYLNPEGKLLVEIGFNQGSAVTELFEENGFTEIKIIKDLSGLDRVVRGKRYV